MTGDSQRNGYRVLALDIDNTLVRFPDPVAPRVQRAVRAAADAGVTVLLVTGRAYRRALPVAEKLGLTTPLISNHGGVIAAGPRRLSPYDGGIVPETGYRPFLAAPHVSERVQGPPIRSVRCSDGPPECAAFPSHSVARQVPRDRPMPSASDRSGG